VGTREIRMMAKRVKIQSHLEDRRWRARCWQTSFSVGVTGLFVAEGWMVVSILARLAVGMKSFSGAHM